MEALENPGFIGAILEMTFAIPGYPPPRRWRATFVVEVIEGELRPGMALLVAESGRRYPVRIDGLVRIDAIPDVRQRSFFTSVAKRAGSATDNVLYVVAYGLQDELRPAPLRLMQAVGMDNMEDAAIRAPSGIEELRALANQSASIREAAVQALAALERDAPVEPLMFALDDEASAVRWKAPSALAKLGSRAPVAPFLERYRDMSAWNQSLQHAAVDVFSAHPENPNAVSALTELLYSQNNQTNGVTNAAAVKALGRLGQQAPVDLLIEELAHNPAYGVRASAAWALSELDDERVGAALARALKDQESFVREAAASVILRRASQASPVAHDQAQEVLCLKQEREEPSEEWLAIYERAQAIVQEKNTLWESLMAQDQERMRSFERTITPDTLEGWQAALTHDELETRVAALKRLASLGPDTPIEPFITALSDPDGNVSMNAAEALAELGGLAPMDERVAEALFSLIARSRDDPQFAASNAIISLALWLPRDTLIAHLGDASWYARQAALEALISLGPDAPAEPLIAAVGDVSEHIRDEALKALHEHFPTAFARIALEAEAVLAEGTIGPTWDSLAQYALVNQILCWGVTSPEAIAELRRLSAHPFWIVRWQAVDALKELEEPLSAATIERLTELRNDPDSSAIREAVAEILEQISCEGE